MKPFPLIVKCKKLHFTLMELLVVFFLISIGASLTGMKLTEMYKDQRFFSESAQILGHLRMAQDLMLILDTDITVKFFYKDGRLSMQLKAEKPLNDGSRRLVERIIGFDGIKNVEYEESKQKISSAPLDLSFTLGNMPKGTLKLKETSSGIFSDKSHTYSIELPGFPAPIRQSPPETGRISRERDESEILYPMEIFEKIYKSEPTT